MIGGFKIVSSSSVIIVSLHLLVWLASGLIGSWHSIHLKRSEKICVIIQICKCNTSELVTICCYLLIPELLIK